MNLSKSEVARRLMPAIVVGGVLVASFLAQAPSLASNNDVGYGYANNCGVKGDGMHDHGKVCPNRPFPGHGFGVLRVLGLGATPPESARITAGHPNNKARTQIGVEAAVTNTSSQGADDLTALVNGHGRGHTH